MDITWTGILILISIFIYATWDTFFRKRNLPPGPTPLPLIGTLLHIRRGELVNSLMKLYHQYGSVYTLYFGPRPVIVLCGFEVVKEALIDRDEEFCARYPLPVLERFAKGYGINLSNGERWKLTRNFTMRTLKRFGFGKKSIECKIQTEVQYIVDEFKKTNDRFEYKDERFIKLLGFVDESFQVLSSTWGQLHSILPIFMDYIPGPHHKISRLAEEMVEFIHDRVKVSQDTLDPSSPRHFIDSFLIKIEEEKNNPDTKFDLRNLLITTQNLLIAGIETVSTTLRYGLLILLKYPEIQAKLHNEIDQVIGRDRLPNFDDRMQMHYTQAVIHEIQRFCDIAPLNVPHMVTKDVQFRGYHIPKGTEIYPLLCTVHRDPKHFSSPWKFNPNHFLDENGKFKKNDALMAFSAGKRICPGKNMACMELFIFFTTILQNFTLTAQIEITEADIAPRLKGFLNAPINYEMSCLPR